MLQSVRALEKCTVRATDGDIGHVYDFLFNDAQWKIQHLVVNTGDMWVGPEEVLIAPPDYRYVDLESRRLHLALSKEGVKTSPGIETHRPVTRQFERNYRRHFELPSQWGYDTLWGSWGYPHDLIIVAPRVALERSDHDDPHLRSAREVLGYIVRATDEGIGHVHDFLIDEQTWTIRYLVIATSRLWFGKYLLLPPSWAQDIQWINATVSVRLTARDIRESPAWNRDQPVDRQFEQRLYSHYGRAGYWETENASPKNGSVTAQSVHAPEG